MARRFFTWILLFLGLSLVFQGLFPKSSEEQQVVGTDDIVLQLEDDSYSLREGFEVEVINQSERRIELSSNCPRSPFVLEKYSNGKWESVSLGDGKYLVCAPEEPTHSQELLVPQSYELSPKSSQSLSFKPWKDEALNSFGSYRLLLEVDDEGETRQYMTEFVVDERGFVSSVAYQLFFRPLYNLVVYLSSVMPSENVGLGIILVTLLIRLTLLVPNKRALQSQKAMMKIQPELEALKKKYKGDQARISQETIALWKKHNVNPAGGCLPILMQLPLLIAIFYVVRTGFSPFESQHLYPFLDFIDMNTLDSSFFGILDINVVNRTWLPLLVGILQFFQLKLSFQLRAQKKKEEKKVVDIKENGEPDLNQIAQDPMQMMNKTMLYVMPVMLALMAATFPAGVGLYLMVSTGFGIFQQYTVNRQ